MFDTQRFTEIIAAGYQPKEDSSYGRDATASTGAILRKIAPQEQQGADIFFGEKSFEVEDLLRKDSNAHASMNILRLLDIQNYPINLAAENYPISEFYDIKDELTALGIGEALVTALDEKGRRTSLASTMLRAIRSRMAILTEEELQESTTSSALTAKYNQSIDRESAYEILISAPTLKKPERKPRKKEKSLKEQLRHGKEEAPAEFKKPL